MEPSEQGSGATASGPSVTRPVAVTFVAFLALTVGVYHTVHAVIALVEGGGASTLAEGALDLALGLLAVVIGLAALRVRRWAWVAFMTWALIGLVHQLLRHFFYDHPDYPAMALDTLCVLVLTPLDVQIAFGVRPPPNVVLERATSNPREFG